MTIISFGSLIGAFVVPFMEKSFYKKTLMCMVSLAVGVLSGSGIFHLIPSVRCFFFMFVSSELLSSSGNSEQFSLKIG